MVVEVTVPEEELPPPPNTSEISLRHFHRSAFRIPAGAGNFSLLHSVKTGSGAHSASYPMGTGGFLPGIKRPEREAYHPPSSRAEVKNAWSYTSNPKYVFMACCLIKYRDNLTLLSQLSNSMEQKASSEANSHSASQEIPHTLLNPKAHYSVKKGPATCPCPEPYATSPRPPTIFY
jgi:hypothetical protein